MKKRILSAVVLCFVFIPFLILGGLPFAWCMLTVSMISLYELLHLREEKRKFPFITQLIAYFTVAYLTLNQYDATGLSLVLDYRILSILIFSFFFPIVVISDNKKYNLDDAFYLFGSTLFLGLSFNLIVLIRNYSLNYLLFLFIITIMTDTFAYISGSMVGKHKLCENVSPKKTVEGLIGGTIMGVVSSMMFYLEVIDPSISVIVLLIVTITLSLIGQIGDLVFSAIKRYYDKKDFSNLIPGHGGILDRFDSIIFVALCAVIFIAII